MQNMSSADFEKGFHVPNYVAQLQNYRSLVKKLMQTAEVAAEETDALRTAAAAWPQPVRATMMTEDWCGDSACNLPVLAALFEGAAIPFRVFRGSEHAELKNGYEAEGDDHIPVVSLWDGNGTEIGRWIEAPQAAGSRKEAWKAERPNFEELYLLQKTGDKQAAAEFGKLYRQFLEEMAVWYKDGLWRETVREVIALF